MTCIVPRDGNSITFDFMRHFWAENFHLKSLNFVKTSNFENAFRIPYKSKNARQKSLNRHVIGLNSAQRWKFNDFWPHEALLGQNVPLRLFFTKIVRCTLGHFYAKNHVRNPNSRTILTLFRRIKRGLKIVSSPTCWTY